MSSPEQIKNLFSNVKLNKYWHRLDNIISFNGVQNPFRVRACFHEHRRHAIFYECFRRWFVTGSQSSFRCPTKITWHVDRFSRAVDGDTGISACIIELNWRVKIQKAERGNILLTY